MSAKARQRRPMCKTQDHLEACDGYENLRNGKDLTCFKDKVKCFHKVVQERQDLMKRFRKAKKSKDT